MMGKHEVLKLSWKEFEAQINEFIEKAQLITFDNLGSISESEYNNKLSEYKNWKNSCHSYLLDAFEGGNNEFARDFLFANKRNYPAPLDLQSCGKM